MKAWNFLFVVMIGMISGNGLAQKTFGESVDVKKKVAISELMKHSEKYEGKEVTVDGMVTDVCSKRGCWMTLQSDEKFKNLRIKVEDGVMVFPMSARGKVATVKGIFKSKKLSLEDTKKFYAHKAEEKKMKFDPNSVKEAMTLYQVQATGAVIN